MLKKEIYMNLVEIEEIIKDSCKIKILKNRNIEELKKILANEGAELYKELENELPDGTYPKELKIEYDSTALLFDHTGGNLPFIRIKYLLYVPGDELPEYNYHVDLDGSGVVLDDYLMKW